MFSTTLTPTRALRRHLHLKEFGNFAVVGVVCTLLFLLAYHVARMWLPPLAANGLAFTSTAGLNFLANRSFTYRVRSGSISRQAAQYAACYLLGLGASSLALLAFFARWPHPSRDAELMAVLLSGGLATVIRYVSMSLWVFRTREPLSPSG